MEQSIKTAVFETIVLDICNANDNSTRLISVYFPYLGKALNEKKEFVICGDLNARHRIWCIVLGKLFNINEIAKNFQITIMHTNDSIYVPFARRFISTLLDLVLTNIAILISDMQILNELHSSHLPVKFFPSFQALMKENFKMDCNKANEKSYQYFRPNSCDGQQINANFISMIEDVNNCINPFNMKNFPRQIFLDFPTMY